MWSGRFREPLDQVFEQWQKSIVFDWQLLPQEAAASKAHAKALAAAGVLSSEELVQITSALDDIVRVYWNAEHQHEVRDHATAEDIHHFVELALVERVG